MIELIIYFIIGLGLGAFAGLVPGMHPNLVGFLVLGLLPGDGMLTVIVTLLVSAEFFKFIRMTFLFVPDETSVLAMHPIFRFVQDGKGLIALKYCLVGLIAAFLIAIIASPLLVVLVPFVIANIKSYVPFMLLAVAIYLVMRDKKWYFAIPIFIASGIVGWYGLQIMNQPLLVLFTGFFALPILLKMNKSLPRQFVSEEFTVEKPSIARGIIGGFLSSLFIVFLPAVGPAQASVFSRGMLNRTEDFFVSIGAISGFQVIFSMILLYTIGRARIGLLESFGTFFNIDFNAFVIMLVIALTTAVISYVLVWYSSKRIVRIVPNVNYRAIAYSVIFLLCAFIFYFDGFLGLGFFALAGAIGWAANKYTRSLTHCMGSLVIPTLLYYFT